MKKLFPAVVLFGLILIGCSAGTTTTKDDTYSVKNISPGQCRIIADIIKIDTSLSGNSDNDPCSKSPCTAWIKVKKIIGYGAGSAGLNNGDTLKTKFAFTLSPTNKKTFPTLNENYPGLNEGSSFEADIQLMPSNPIGNNKGKVYLVYGYKKIE